MEYKDYYQVLGVDASATAEEIKVAYKKLARKYHPDVSTQSNAQERFKELGEAYDILKDKQKRAEYDQLRAYMTGEGRFGSTDSMGGGTFTESDVNFDDLIKSIFGSTRGYREDFRGSHFTARGEDLRVRLQISLEEAYHGAQKQLSIPSETGTRKINVKIPSGITHGKELRLQGQGREGVGGAGRGDLYLEIDILPHPYFVLDNKDITLVVPVAPWEAALGTELEVQTLGGRVKLKVPENSQNGKKFRLKAKGLGKDAAGDQYVILKIVNPPVRSDAEKECFDLMRKRFNFNPRAEKVV